MDGHNSKPKHTIIYPKIPSAIRHFQHDDSLPVPKPPPQWTMHEEEPTKNSPEDEIVLMFQCGSSFPETNCTSIYIAFLTQ